jgi:hypothetical protein
MTLTADFIRVYPSIRDIIEEAKSHDNPMRYYAFRSASVRGNWFAKNYIATRRTVGLQGCLKEAGVPTLERNMIKDVAQVKKIGNNKNFQRLEMMLPELLEHLAKKEVEHAESLMNLSRRMIKEQIKTEEALARIEEEAEEKTKSKKPKDDLLGLQNAAVEEIIATALSTVNGKDAHRIRTLLAKRDDKLLVLQQELANLS